MDRDEVSELHFITSIDNLESILMRGILSHNRPFAPDLKAAVGRMQNNRILTEQPRGNMIEIRSGSALDDAREL